MLSRCFLTDSCRHTGCRYTSAQAFFYKLVLRQKIPVCHICGKAGSKMPKTQTAWFIVKHWASMTMISWISALLSRCHCCWCAELQDSHSDSVRVCESLNLNDFSTICALDVRIFHIQDTKQIQTESQWEHPGVSGSSLCKRRVLPTSPVKCHWRQQAQTLGTLTMVLM